MPIDQAHEQNNMIVNSCSGVVGLTENPVAVRNGLILTRYNPDIAEKHDHHEKKNSAQKLFKQQFLSLVQVFHEWGIHFLKHLMRAVEPELANCNG